MIAVLLLSIQIILPIISGTEWTTLSLSENSVSDESDFEAFNKDSNLLQVRFTQLLDQTNLNFELSLKLYKEESQADGFLGSVDFAWNTATPSQSSLKFNENYESYDACTEPSGSALTQAVPSLITLNLLNTPALITGDGVEASMGEDCIDGVESWTKVQEELLPQVTFVKVYLKDSNSYGVDGYSGLQEYFLIDYRVAQACTGGQYLSDKTGCTACATGTYNSGGFTEECAECPEGTTVEAGSGAAQGDCVTVAVTCDAGSYLASDNTCSPCGAGTYSTDPVSGVCTACPEGATVGEGLGLSVADCKETVDDEDDDSGSMLMFQSQQIWILLSVLLFSLSN